MSAMMESLVAPQIDRTVLLVKDDHTHVGEYLDNYGLIRSGTREQYAHDWIAAGFDLIEVPA